jgi:outer membrane receptor protein involved in Fe transport
LPGLKEYRNKHKNDGWQHDFRSSYKFSDHLKLSFIVSNLFNQEYMSRPGYVEAPRMFTTQVVIKF